MLSNLIMKAKEEKTKEPWITRSNYASRMGDVCVRRLCYFRTHYDVQEKFDVRGQARVDLGKLLEQYSRDQINMVLRQYGIEIERQEVPAKWDEYEISGKIDGIIHLSQAEIDAGAIIPETNPKDRTVSMVLEIKSVRDSVFDQIEELKDLQNYWWMKKYITQVQLYLVSLGLENGILFLISTDGRFKDFMLTIDLEEAEKAVKKAERVQEYMKAYEAAGKPHDDHKALAGFLPDRINHDMAECKRCSFRAVCNPPMQFGDELQVLEDEVLLECLEERARTKADRDIYEKSHKKVRDCLGNRENLLVGDWWVHGKANKKGSVTYKFQKLEQGEQAPESLGGE